MRLHVKTPDGARLLDDASGGTIARILRDNGLGLNQRCGGDGDCGGCRVVLEQGSFTVGERQLLVDPAAPRQVRACRTVARGDDCVLQVPAASLFALGGSIEQEFELPPFRLDAQALRLCVAVPPARLQDHRSDAERVCDALRQQGGIALHGLSLAQTRQLCELLAQGADSITATLVAEQGQWQVIGLHPGEQLRPLYGIAIDIGTTTVAAVLVDLHSGAVVRRASRYNQQLQVADDLASRISQARTAEQRERMRRLVLHETIQPITESLLLAQQVQAADVCRVAIAGNTVMVHLLLGLPVRNIGRLPFNPALRDPGLLSAAQIGLKTARQAQVAIAPAIAGYIGGDITAGILASGLLQAPHGSLLVDIGTNCEMVLAIGDRLVCCSSPAGPAFEGAGMLHGCRATEGAIEHIAIGPDLGFTIGTIGGAAAIGVCGSAVIDFIGQARWRGLLNAAGRMDIALLQRLGRHARVTHAGRAFHACIIVPAEPADGQQEIVITEADIAEILQAKAAISAGIETLLGHCGLPVGDLAQLILAGGFARHIDLANASRIGMLPALPPGRMRAIGNAALAGATLMLVDPDALQAMRQLHVRPEVVELNLLPDFESNFIAAMMLPEPVQAPQPHACV